MSTLTDHLAAPNTPIERRFYSRVAPQTPTPIAFGSNFQNTVLNVSENGLLVSATPALQQTRGRLNMQPPGPNIYT